jgi:hypothetical protein
MVENAPANGFRHFCAAVDLTNSQNILVAWSAIDTANQDLRLWKVTEGSTTEMTNVVQNATDDCGLAAVSIDTANADRIHVFWVGNPDGSETWSTNVNIYCKGTMDGGTTWSPIVKMTNLFTPTARTLQIRQLWCIPRTTGNHCTTVSYNNNFTNQQDIYINKDYQFAGGSFQLGI